MPEILDLDVFSPEARSASFTDRAGKRHVFDVTFVSFKTSIFMLAHLEEFRALTNMDASRVDENTFRLILGVVEEIGQHTDKELTVDFLLENLSIVQGMKLLEVAMEPIISFLGSNPPGAAAQEVQPE